MPILKEKVYNRMASNIIISDITYWLLRRIILEIDILPRGILAWWCLYLISSHTWDLSVSFLAWLLLLFANTGWFNAETTQDCKPWNESSVHCNNQMFPQMRRGVQPLSSLLVVADFCFLFEGQINKYTFRNRHKRLTTLEQKFEYTASYFAFSETWIQRDWGGLNEIRKVSAVVWKALSKELALKLHWTSKNLRFCIWGAEVKIRLKKLWTHYFLTIYEHLKTVFSNSTGVYFGRMH